MKCTRLGVNHDWGEYDVIGLFPDIFFHLSSINVGRLYTEHIQDYFFGKQQHFYYKTLPLYTSLGKLLP